MPRRLVAILFLTVATQLFISVYYSYQIIGYNNTSLEQDKTIKTLIEKQRELVVAWADANKISKVDQYTKLQGFFPIKQTINLNN